jgi:hypothetical protein
VLNYKGEPIYYPAAYPPEFFKNAGEQAAQLQTITSSSDFPSTLPISDLYKFRQGGEWDMQRLTGPVDANYIDYATVAIGIYSHSAQIPVEDILYIQNAYAGINSKYDKGTIFDKIYNFLPERNVYNTRMGYSMLW